MCELADMTIDQAARVLRRVRAECVLDDFCWIWRGCMKNGDSQPQANIAPFRGVSLPRLVYMAQHGRAPRKGMYVVPACGNRRCLACLVEATRSKAQQLAAARGVYSHPVAVANRTAALRKRSRYSDDVIAVARNADTAAEAVRATGISPSYVRSLRAGLVRVPALGVWGGLPS